jgi:hypothetical protein
MAIVKGFLQMTGSIKGVTFYTTAGSDKVIMRTKGGPTSNRMATGAEFAKVRQHQVEWSGCVQFAQALRDAIGETYRLADYNLFSVWNGMGKNLMKMDTVNEPGTRWLRLSEYKQELEGFNFNRNYPFTTIFRVSPSVDLNRELLQATVTVPRVNTESDLQNIQRLPYFRLIVCMGLVSDMKYNPDGMTSKYEPVVNDLQGMNRSTVSEWHSTNDILAQHTLSVQLDERIQPLLTDEVTVLLSMGIEFGNVGFGDQISEVKRAGCGKILKSC